MILWKYELFCVRLVSRAKLRRDACLTMQKLSCSSKNWSQNFLKSIQIIYSFRVFAHRMANNENVQEQQRRFKTSEAISRLHRNTLASAQEISHWPVKKSREDRKRKSAFVVKFFNVNVAHRSAGFQLEIETTLERLNFHTRHEKQRKSFLTMIKRSIYFRNWESFLFSSLLTWKLFRFPEHKAKRQEGSQLICVKLKDCLEEFWRSQTAKLYSKYWIAVWIWMFLIHFKSNQFTPVNFKLVRSSKFSF